MISVHNPYYSWCVDHIAYDTKIIKYCCHQILKLLLPPNFIWLATTSFQSDFKAKMRQIRFRYRHFDDTPTFDPSGLDSAVLTHFSFPTLACHDVWFHDLLLSPISQHRNWYSLQSCRRCCRNNCLLTLRFN